MGRRSINTTKSGKYMNPTDQARKEARKKELKKNKKQRQMVRAAVLKGKDPQQLILDLEKIDQMEYNVLQPSPLNEKVLKDKRKKLKDTLDRVLKMYNKDDPDKWAELKRLQLDYERKRAALFNYYESVKNAQQVQVDDIPLPIAALPAELQAVFVGIPSQIPLPAHAPPHLAMRPPALPPAYMQPHHSILKKTSAYIGKESEKRKEPPGVPVGPPPELNDEEPMEQEYVPQNAVASARTKTIRFADDDRGSTEEKQEKERVRETEIERLSAEDREGIAERIGENNGENPEAEDPKPRPTSLQQKMLAMAGQDIDQFMKEMEEVHKKRKADRAADLESRLQALEHKAPSSKQETSPAPASTPREAQPAVPAATSANATVTTTSTSITTSPTVAASVTSASASSSDPAPAPLAPTPRPSMNMMPGMPSIMFRPPPPRGVPALMGIRLPPGPPPGLPPRLGIRLPPGPPPGMPSRLMRPAMPPVVPPAPAPAQTNVLTAGPQLITRPEKTGATIQAEAQIRNLSADVTRFLPTALRVKRDPKQKREVKGLQTQEMKPEVSQPPTRNVQTKDDAYLQFMREMKGLL